VRGSKEAPVGGIYLVSIAEPVAQAETGGLGLRQGMSPASLVRPSAVVAPEVASVPAPWRCPTR
jgi:hypothetical protein